MTAGRGDRAMVALWVACAILGFAMPAAAQVTIPQEYGKTIKSAETVGALGPDLFGDQTNFYTGSTSFVVNDVGLAGNNALPVSAGRRYVVEDRGDLRTPGLFADWDLEIPHMHGIFAKTSLSDIGWQVSEYQRPYARCSVSSDATGMPPTAAGPQGGLFDGSEFWHGNSLYVPGKGDMELLTVASENPHRPTDGTTYHWMTSDQWFLSCLPATANGVTGEAFLALAPDGTRYRFDWVVRRPAATITKALSSGPIDFMTASSKRTSVAMMTAGFALLHREEIWILPTLVTDRFGNTVTYTYNAASPWQVSTIASSDGRQLTFGYNTAGRIASISDGTRTWAYAYHATNGTLVQVTLPDASKWTYDLGALGWARVTQLQSDESGSSFYCEAASSSPAQSTYTGTMTHPSGAVGTFAFRATLHGRSYVAKQCIYPAGITGRSNYARHPFLFDALSLQTKTISGMGLAPMQWDYTYGPTNNSWLGDCPNDSCIGTKTVEVAGPGEWMRYTYSNRWRHSEGKLLKVEQGEGPASIMKTETTSYLLDRTGQCYPAEWGRSPYVRGDHTSQRPAPLLRREILQQGRSFLWQADEFDCFARPTTVTRSSE